MARTWWINRSQRMTLFSWRRITHGSYAGGSDTTLEARQFVGQLKILIDRLVGCEHRSETAGQSLIDRAREGSTGKRLPKANCSRTFPFSLREVGASEA